MGGYGGGVHVAVSVIIVEVEVQVRAVLVLVMVLVEYTVTCCGVLVVIWENVLQGTVVVVGGANVESVSVSVDVIAFRLSVSFFLFNHSQKSLLVAFGVIVYPKTSLMEPISFVTISTTYVSFASAYLLA